MKKYQYNINNLDCPNCARKLEETLNQTYAKWLEQVEKSPFTNRGEISLDESRYSNEIESILASSTVPNKEIIAEKIKAEFEKKKAKIILLIFAF